MRVPSSLSAADCNKDSKAWNCSPIRKRAGAGSTFCRTTCRGGVGNGKLGCVSDFSLVSNVLCLVHVLVIIFDYNYIILYLPYCISLQWYFRPHIPPATTRYRLSASIHQDSTGPPQHPIRCSSGTSSHATPKRGPCRAPSPSGHNGFITSRADALARLSISRPTTRLGVTEARNYSPNSPSMGFSWALWLFRRLRTPTYGKSSPRSTLSHAESHLGRTRRPHSWCCL